MKQSNFWIRALLFVSLISGFVVSANASHFRGGYITASIDSYGMVTVSAESLWKTTFVGSIGSLSILKADRSPTLKSISLTTATNDTSDPSFTRVLETGTASLATLGLPKGDYILRSSRCCRITGLANNVGIGSFSFETLVHYDGTDNNAPKINSTVITGVAQGFDYSQNINAVDPDGTPLSYQLLTNSAAPDYAPTSQIPGMTIDNTGQIVIPAASTTTLQSVNASNPAGDYVFKVRVTDGSGAYTDRDVMLDVVASGSNTQPPTLDAIGNRTVFVGTTLLFTFNATDSYAGATVTLSATGMPTNATFQSTAGNPATGTFSFTPTNSDVGTYTINFEARDNGTPSLASSQQVTIIVAGNNHAPTLNSIGNKSVAVNGSLSFTVSATDVDGNAITLSASFLPTGATFDPATGVFNWTPTTQGVTSGIVFQAMDNGTPNLSSQESITITVGPGNQPPSITIHGLHGTRPGKRIVLSVTAFDPNGDTVTLSVGNGGLPPSASFVASTGMMDWTPTSNQLGLWIINFHATDNYAQPLTSNGQVKVGVGDYPDNATATDPNNPDTDGDGLSDGVETDTGTFVSASDAGTDPVNQDSNNNGVNDGAEVANGSNPLPVVNTTTQNSVVGVTSQTWQALKTIGDTTTVAGQFSSSLSNDPTDLEAAIGLCVTKFADLMADPKLLPLLTSMTSDNGVTLPSSSTVAMSIANNTVLQNVNWLTRMAVTGTQVQNGAFAPVVPQISHCITQLNAVLAAGFVSQSITNPVSMLGGNSSVQVDADDVKLLVAQMHALRERFYWLDAYNWDTDVDKDGVLDTLPVTFTDSVTGTVYQYYTISTDPYAVFHDPTFFTKRASGAMKGNGAQNLTAALADAKTAATLMQQVFTNFNNNATRGLDSNHLFSFGSSSKLATNLTDATNIDNALNGTGYSTNFKQPSGGQLAGVVHAEISYPLLDRSMLPSLKYDIPPDPVASKKKDFPTVFDGGAGRVVKSSIYVGTFPDPTLGGALSGGATLDQQDQQTRPSKTLLLTLNGVPLPRNGQSVPSGWENWSQGVMGDSSGNLFVLQTISSSTNGTVSYQVYSVNAATGALTAVAGKSGVITGSISGSGTSVGSNFFISGTSGTQYGFWNLGSGSLVPVTRPTGVSICSANVLRPSGSATGLVHWYHGYPKKGSYVALTSTTNNGNLTVREQYPAGVLRFFNVAPLGLDSTLGWLVYDPDSQHLVRVNLGSTANAPTSAQAYYAPWFGGGGFFGFTTTFGNIGGIPASCDGSTANYFLTNGQMADVNDFPKVRLYPLPTLTAFPTTTTANILP